MVQAEHTRDLSIRKRLPGMIAAGLMTLAACIWTSWGASEIYFENWGTGEHLVQLAHMMPAVLVLTMLLVALRWPWIGGLVILVLGGGLVTWWLIGLARWGELDLEGVVILFPMSSVVFIIGALFLLEGRRQKRLREADVAPHPAWWRRNLRYLLAVGLPLAVLGAVSAYHLPYVLSREDDGKRGARLIRGNGVTLIWAPKGPGWNWRQKWGGYPSWDQLARYGITPRGFGKKPGLTARHATRADMQITGLCRYLSRDGKRLEATAQNIWRMPTVREIVRSLVRHGRNAGCRWNGRSSHAHCRVRPNKGTPLWAPDEPPNFYWADDEDNAREAYFVPYTGGLWGGGAIGSQPKHYSNPRHGYRCVRRPRR